MSTDLPRRVRALGFRLLQLPRIDARRFLIVDRQGLTVKGDEDRPLTIEDVDQFLQPFEDRSWIP